jgi:hypothetical protein
LSYYVHPRCSFADAFQSALKSAFQRYFSRVLFIGSLPFGILSIVYYYVHPKVLCSYVVAVFQWFLAVEGCLNGVLELCRMHGKSPCFSALGFLTTADVDEGVLVFTVADGVVFHE